MELIKDIVKQFYPILIMCACVSFVIYVFFSANYNGGEGVFENAGNIYTQMIGNDDLKNDGLNYIGEETNSYVPEIKYNSGSKRVGECIKFKEQFLAKKEDGSFVNGSTEDDFALYLVDIKKTSGNSVLERLSSEEVGKLEEIPAPFIYDKEQDLLYIFGSGVYIVEIKVYGNSGAAELLEFKLPVETS